MECSSLWLPEPLHFNHSQDELGYHLSETKYVAFSFLCVSWWHGRWEEDSIISSVFLDLCVVLPVSYLQWQQNEKFVLTVFQWISAQKFTSEPSLSGVKGMNRVYILHSYWNWFPCARSPEDMELLDTVGKGDCLLGDL